MSGLPPFTVLHVCMGNICRSPMAELLFAAAAGQLVCEGADKLVHSHGAGTHGWHHGDPMDPGAARQIRRRGADPTTFRARRLRPEHIEGSDLVLTATAEQREFVEQLTPDAAERTFVLGEFGRLLRSVDVQRLPEFVAEPNAVYARGSALVAAVAAARAGRPALPGDDLDDPWGQGERTFARVADEIEHTVLPLARTLLTAGHSVVGAPSGG